jgi:hypothetical protein
MGVTMWILVVAFLINGQWHQQERGPFPTQEACEQANVQLMMQVTYSGMRARGDCGMRL